LFVLVPILLLIFILNNGPRVKGSYLGFDAHTRVPQLRAASGHPGRVNLLVRGLGVVANPEFA
jgi:hypothetical protein